MNSYRPSSCISIVTKLIVLDLFISILFIIFEPTYIFDWDAYMEQVAQVFSGELDYKHLHGDTGPLVYPAGFVWLFMLFKAIFQWDHTLYTTEYVPKNFTEFEHDLNVYHSETDYTNRNVRPFGRMIALQLMFTGVYLCGNGIVARLYQRTKTMPWWSVFMLMCSRRIHSIFVLGLFNDCWSTLLLIIALYYYVEDRWEMGCIFFSLAVSIKMNVLLFAPSLLILMCQRYNFRYAIYLIGICALVQFIVALPFLITHPLNYVAGAFDISRQFFHQWSVNWQFIPEWVFLNKIWSVGLLVGQIVTLYLFADYKWTLRRNKSIVELFKLKNFNRKYRNKALDIEHILTVMLTGNYIGIVFCRSLHYQFYSWYYFSIPYLLWRTNLPLVLKILFPLLIEISWNQHPPAIWSSILLQSTHFGLLGALWKFKQTERGGGLPLVD